MATLSIHIMPRDIPEEILKKYAVRSRVLRLKSLQTDPASFISKYESEVKEPPEFWLNRLRDPDAHHLVMIHSETPPSPEDPHVLLQDDAEWVAIVVVVEVGRVSPETIAREAFNASKKKAHWFLAAVYVDASVRGQGNGRKIVQASIDLMREESRKANLQSPACVSNVSHGNDLALALYQKLGFRITNEDAPEGKEGRIHHTTEIMMDL